MAFNYEKYREAQFKSPLENSPAKAGAVWTAITKAPKVVKGLAKWATGGGGFEALFPSDKNKSTLENFAQGAYEWSGAKDIVSILKGSAKATTKHHMDVASGKKQDIGPKW